MVSDVENEAVSLSRTQEPDHAAPVRDLGFIPKWIFKKV